MAVDNDNIKFSDLYTIITGTAHDGINPSHYLILEAKVQSLQLVLSVLIRILKVKHLVQGEEEVV